MVDISELEFEQEQELQQNRGEYLPCTYLYLPVVIFVV